MAAIHDSGCFSGSASCQSFRGGQAGFRHDDAQGLRQDGQLGGGVAGRVAVDLDGDAAVVGRAEGDVRGRAVVHVGQVEVTSAGGAFSPTLACPMAMGCVDAGCAEVGTTLQLDFGRQQIDAEVVKLPFHKRGG